MKINNSAQKFPFLSQLPAYVSDDNQDFGIDSPHMDDTPPSNSHTQHSSKALGSLLYRTFCCCFRRKKQVKFIETPEVRLFTTSPISPLPDQTFLNIPPLVLETARQPTVQNRTFFKVDVESDSTKTALLSALVYWRQSMIKDMFLPSVAVCEQIIHENHYDELFILKNLFKNPKNKDKFSDLTPQSQRVLTAIGDEQTCSILKFMTAKQVAILAH